jgi:hypothetical protein
MERPAADPLFQVDEGNASLANGVEVSDIDRSEHHRLPDVGATSGRSDERETELMGVSLAKGGNVSLTKAAPDFDLEAASALSPHASATVRSDRFRAVGHRYESGPAGLAMDFDLNV